VVEVQYSNIEEKVLYDRTKFWVDLGFTVVWIFNDKNMLTLRESTKINRGGLGNLFGGEHFKSFVPT